ncbi:MULTISPECIES: Na+/H+ antiporter [unclassified Coleofasciculus]|uniref:Na+/H+ antiporter n=1 Tax=unclassified Coleofasciculus TaxID=2692782 RepID=UPI00187E73B7|nr:MULTISPECIES: Na+/H+ antiporter [unclassified Coleofasciculus]MBE9126112.1 Na+/H+ antiporter [Coleofasciculus sp. LEGE 07081]MBE9147533.1 Na+/H+ antiporter [Coleofasciculus sp. LEGE 07092]
MSVESSIGEAAIEQNLEQFVLVLSVSLSVATVSRVFPWFRKIPYTLLLVIVGLGLAFVDVRLVNLSPELILEIFLPPLLFEAAWNIRWRDLRRDLVPVILFAVVGVVISVVGIAFTIHELAGLPIAIALLIGASLSATDPVSVIALFRELGADKRLKTLMEGESLFNDGVAVVAFLLLVGIPLGTGEFALSTTFAQFFVFVGIGIGVGCLVGFGISFLTQRFDLPLVEQSLTLVSAYGTYLLTEELGGSGVIGVVTVGVILGNFGSRIGMNPRTRLIVSEFWDFLAFFVNSIVFLLIGDQINFPRLGDHLGLIAVAVMAVLLTRAIAIYTLAAISNRVVNSQITWQQQTVLWWGGLRGSVSIALALSVPIFLEGRQDIIDAVFGVVLFTLLVQGLTTQFLLEKLNLIGDQPLRQKYSETQARGIALNRVKNYLLQATNSNEVDPEFGRYQIKLVEDQLESIRKESHELLEQHPQLQTFDLEQVRERMINIEADTYAEFIRAGRLNENLSPILQEALIEADEKLMESD